MAYTTYKKVDVETASQGKLIVMLFNGAIAFSDEARRALEAGNFVHAHKKLLQAQNILTELRAALNMDAGELAENLDKIYEYITHLLVQANVKKDTALIQEATTLMDSMRNTWRELFESQEVNDDRPQPAARLNQHGAVAVNLTG